jgi:ribosomal protein L29
MKNEIFKKSKDELEKMLSLKQIALRDMRFGQAGGKSKDVKAYAKTRKDVARIYTALKQK